MSSSAGPIKRKTGVRNEEKYQRNVIRKARVKGLAYQSYSGKQVVAKVQQTYHCKCAERCYGNISEETRNKLWNQFHSLESKDMQDTYLQSLIEKREPKKRRKVTSKQHRSEDEGEIMEGSCPKAATSKPKNRFFSYYIKIDGNLKLVCKNTFMTLHGVTPTRVLRLCDVLMAGKSPRDMRGLSRSGNAVSGAICLKIHDHISKYPVKQAHCGGNLRNYLDTRLNIKMMHEMFLNENPDCVNKVKYNFYNKYFQENFDYSFGRPQMDVCSKCQSFLVKMKDRTLCDCAKRRIAAEQMVHIWHANKFYAALQEAYDNKEDDTVAIAFDFMQNQPLPLIPVQEMFYLNQLQLNVFCIHDIKARKANLYLYHEGIANKSADEVCTFLLHYIQTLPPMVTKLLLFSDGAEGHFKNHTVIRFLLSLCDGGGFETIRHFFPFCGHSFLPCDHDFGCLKRQLSKIDCIYTPDQYGELFVNASTTGQFTVHHVTTDDILAFKAWWPENYKRMTFCDVPMGQTVSKALKEKFTISSYKEFQYSKQEKGKVVCKAFIASSQKSTFSLGKTRKAPVLPSAKAYPEGRVPINEKKIQDLMKLQDYSVGYETFYNEFFNWTSVNVNAAHMSALDSDFRDDS